MKKIIFIIMTVCFALTGFSQRSFYDFKVKDIDGNDFSFSQLKGKKVLIVNTASKCGNTPQYAELEKYYKDNKDRNFVIIGFPANDFMRQEPGTDAEIKEFCQRNYGVSFPMMSKISVKGQEMHPVYKWLTSKELNGVMDSEVTWNFQKFLINEEGKLVEVLKPKTSVNSLKM